MFVDESVILSIKSHTDDLKRAKKILKEKHNMKVSRKTIERVWNCS